MRSGHLLLLMAAAALAPAAAAAAAAETGGVRGNLSELRARAAEGKLAWGTSIGRANDLLVLPLRQVRRIDVLPVACMMQ
jgi:hypothetical protein